jgi:RNA polymerase subunit RPABC4/transcription elongation factor Spt4
MPQLPDLSGLGRVLELFIAFLGAYLFAVWVSMIIWTIRDIRSRSRDIFAQLLAIVLVLVFNVAGLLLYFILRPREALSEKYERELAEEAMLQDIEERQVCPVCHHKITAEYLVCPNCHTKLHKKCGHCGRVLNLKWGVCPYCGSPQTLPAAPRFASEPPPMPPVREHEVELIAPRDGEASPIVVAQQARTESPVVLTQPVRVESPIVVLPTVAGGVKSEAPPDGRSQPIKSPAAPPVSDSDPKVEESP